MFRSVDDIDLYTGALSEIPLEESILGPTLTCLILDQFVRLKYGDRFWYENPHTIQTFSEQQLREIRKTSLAGIICDNTDHIDNINPFVMERQRKGNEQISCKEIPKPNFEYWKEIHGEVSVPHSFLNVINKKNK